MVEELPGFIPQVLRRNSSYDAGDLVTGRQRIGHLTKVTAHHGDVAMTDTAISDVDQHVVRADITTLDVDATVIHSSKRSAKRAYDGERGYQPVLVLWAEQDVIIADEFRDGNVPAGSGNRRVIEKAVAALPGKYDKIYVRGDSALYEHELMTWLEQKVGSLKTSNYKGKKLATYLDDDEAREQLFDDGLVFRTDYPVDEKTIGDKLKKAATVVDAMKKHKAEEARAKGIAAS